MISRIVIITLIIVLALPIATLTRPDETSPSWAEAAVAAKGKKHKKAKKPMSTTVTRTERQTVTQTFTSTAPLTIPHNAPTLDTGPANPYPSTIEVSGFTHGVITDVDLILTDLAHAFPGDLDILLSTSDGRRALVMSDVGNDRGLVNIDLTLDDEAAAEMPFAEALSSGSFRPTDRDPDDPLPAPAPALNGNVTLSAFDGADPNGTWRLWVIDDADGDVGTLGGWALEITAESDVQAPDQVQVKDKKDKKGKKKGKGKKRRS